MVSETLVMESKTDDGWKKKRVAPKLYPVATAGKKLTIDLPKQQILSEDGEDGEVLVDDFEVEPLRKQLHGMDDIGLTVQKEEFVQDIEARKKDVFSFLEGGSKLVKPIKGAK